MNNVMNIVEEPMESALVQNGLLVALHISQWSGRRLDREVGEKVAHDAGASRDAGNYNKLLVSKSALESFQKITSEAYVLQRELTVPWLDNGVRYLPWGAYHDFLSQVGEIKSRWWIAVEQFLADYPTLVEASKLRLGSMWREKDFPSHSDMRGKFNFNANTYPVPSENDFRIQAEEGQLQELRDNLRRSLQEAQDIAVKDLYNRIYSVVADVATRFRDPDEKVRFKSALITNLRDMVMLMPKLNFTNDPVLEQVVMKAQAQLAGLNPDMLREFPSEREKARDAADDILKTLRGVM